MIFISSVVELMYVVCLMPFLSYMIYASYLNLLDSFFNGEKTSKIVYPHFSIQVVLHGAKAQKMMLVLKRRQAA